MIIRERVKLKEMSMEDIADIMAKAAPNSSEDQLCRAEFLLRQTKLFERSAEAGERAAKAAIDMAQQTERYTRYMFYSVLLLGASIFVSFILEMLKNKP